MSSMERRLVRLQVRYAARPGCTACADCGAVVDVFLAEDGQEITRSRQGTCPPWGSEVTVQVCREYVGLEPECV